MNDETTFENFAEKKLRKIFKNGSPIVISIDDIGDDSTKRALKDIVETGKIAAVIRNEDLNK